MFTFILVLLVLIINATMQLMIFLKTKNQYDFNKNYKRLLLTSIIVQYGFALILFITFIYHMFKKNDDTSSTSEEDSTSKKGSILESVLIFASCIALIYGVIISSMYSLKSHCKRGDDYIHSENDSDNSDDMNMVWKFSTISAIIGAVGVLLILILHMYTRKEEIKNQLMESIVTSRLKPETHPVYAQYKQLQKGLN